MAEAAVKLQKVLNPERSEKKRDSQSKRIDGQQDNSFGDRILGGGKTENDRENGSDAWRPAEGSR